MANAGHDTRTLQAWLGHQNIQHTVRYTELAPNRFKDFWRRERLVENACDPVRASSMIAAG